MYFQGYQSSYTKPIKKLAGRSSTSFFSSKELGRYGDIIDMVSLSKLVASSMVNAHYIHHFIDAVPFIFVLTSPTNNYGNVS